MSDLMGVTEIILNKFYRLKKCKYCGKHNIRLSYNANTFFRISLQCMSCDYKTKNHISGLFAWVEWNMRRK